MRACVCGISVSLSRVEKITGKRPAFFLVDLCDEKAVDLVFRKSPRFDAVIHFAGLKVTARLFTFAVNVCHVCMNKGDLFPDTSFCLCVDAFVSLCACMKT